MPPRSKQAHRQIEWLTCPHCSIRFSNRDTDLHSEVCSVESPFDSQLVNLKTLKHGFVVNDVLVSLLASADAGKDEGKSASKDENKSESFVVRENLLKEKSHRVVFVNPMTMFSCGLSILRPVVINREHIFLAWPDAGLPLTTVAVSDTAAKTIIEAKTKDVVVISRLKGVELNATEVHVRPRQKRACMNEISFLPYFQRRLAGSYVAIGSRVSVNYLSSICDMNVVKILVENGESVSKDDGVAEIDEILSNVSFTEKPCEMHTSADKLVSTTADCLFRFFRVTTGTKLVLVPIDEGRKKLTPSPAVTLDDVGGIENQKALLMRLIKLMLHHRNEELADRYGVRVTRAVLIHGASGTGKTMLVKALAHSLQLKLVPIGGTAVLSPYVGETEKRIEELFVKARREAPSLILIDDVDSLCPRRNNMQNDIERRVTAALCSHIDTLLSEDCQVFVIATTRKKDEISQSLLSATRLGIEQEISIPNSLQRAKILESQLRGVKHNITSSEVASVAARAHGYVGADLAAVCREALLHLIARRRSESDSCLTVDDLSHGLKMVLPSAMKELAIEKPNVKWEDIGGMHELKRRLEEAIILPIRDPELFRRMGAKPPKGHLMYGPPGCSKTMIAKALATECDINFIAVQSSSLMSKWVGESEKSVRELFRKARAAAPAIVFFDEFDAIAGTRGRDGGGTDVVDRVLSQLLTEIDGVVELKDVSILAATNRPDLIDPALKRPGRLGAEIFVGLPSDETRREIFRVSFRRMPVDADVNLDGLVSRTAGYTGAEVKAVADKAAWLSAVEVVGGDVQSDCRVHSRHFDAALDEIQPRTTDSDLKYFDDYRNRRTSSH